jgi:beta-lactam-binding protein with PASTA domain
VRLDERLNRAVPDLTGYGTPGAAVALQNAGLQLGGVGSAVDPRCNYINLVMRQSYGAGTLIPPGSSVSITLGARPRTPCP